MKIYFIGICGTGVGNLAILLKNEGHDVRGSEVSEKFFYPPMSDLLKQNKIPVNMGFDPEEITSDYDLVIMGGAALIHDPNNPQVARAKELGIRLISYARGIGEFISKEENIDVVGNHGKTTTTALIAHLFKETETDGSYFLGGAAKGFETTIYSGKDKWSVCEGDEYPSISQEPGGKFLYHKPKHVLFTSADWDHKNVYKTEEEYLDVFRELFKIIPEDGIITSCLEGKNTLEVLKSSKKNKINLYSLTLYKDSIENEEISETMARDYIDKKILEIKENYPKISERINNIYFVDNVDFVWRGILTKFKIKKLSFKTKKTKDLGVFETPIIGQIGVENSLAAISCLETLGFDLEKIRKGIANFQGVQRKLELIYDSNYKVINDHAHSPIKIQTALKSLRTKFPNNNIFVIFDAHQSGLKERITFNQLKEVFNLANYVLIAKVNPDPKSTDPIFGRDYKDLIKEGAKNAKYLRPGNVYYTPVAPQIRSILENNLSHNDIVVIMSSGDAREFVETAKNVPLNRNKMTGNMEY